MPAIIIIVTVVVAVVVFAAMRRSSIGNGTGSAPAAPSRDMARHGAPLREFPVSGDAALVYFDVPLPDGDVDPVLADLLVREAIEVLRDKQSHDLPLDDVHRVRAFGTRGGVDVEAGSIGLDSPGALPDMAHVEVVPHFSSVPFDPLARLGEADHSAAAGSPQIADKEDDSPALPPLAEELSLTSRIDAGLRAQGVDPATMGAGDMALALMRMAGYVVQNGATADTYVVASPTSTTYVQVVRHAEGEYPELDEHAIKQFQVGFASARTDRGLLITEKFSPYLVYDAERRNPKTKFITRERLQDFVDGFSMG